MKATPCGLLLLLVLGASCTTKEHPSAPDLTAEAFEPVRVVLETNCVHCHDDNRLSTMPPMQDTRGLAKLVATGWIVRGAPEKSRFYQVVTFPDTVPGAMPPSGHAISRKEARVLHDWIKAGAGLPASHVHLHPRGTLPRSS